MIIIYIFFKSEKELILWNLIDIVQFDLINIKLFKENKTIYF
jgi:hypothetical protein